MATAMAMTEAIQRLRPHGEAGPFAAGKSSLLENGWLDPAGTPSLPLSVSRMIHPLSRNGLLQSKARRSAGMPVRLPVDSSATAGCRRRWPPALSSRRMPSPKPWLVEDRSVELAVVDVPGLRQVRQRRGSRPTPTQGAAESSVWRPSRDGMGRGALTVVRMCTGRSEAEFAMGSSRLTQCWGRFPRASAGGRPREGKGHAGPNAARSRSSHARDGDLRRR
jgi:hypothetical protein